jgi:putative membrane-bound dehydrogenase-like protein
MSVRDIEGQISVCGMLLSLAVILVSSASAVSQDPDSKPAANSLFDGTTLKGWEGDLNYWRIENGAIVGEIPKGQTLRKNTWLVWRGGELSDFELILQCRLTGLPAANSGIQFRCQVENVDHVSGYQADFDMGATWLGRIYDEHGRALLVERGSRVDIAEDGRRETETFAPANQYAVLFRENDWNEYRIVAIGHHIAVYVNGTLFSELRDQEKEECDLTGLLAFQLHSGPETRVEFRDIHVERLQPGDSRLPAFRMRKQAASDDKVSGVVPKDRDGKELNLGFEAGDLRDWTATGDAFEKQPLNVDGISQRWPGQISNKQGEFFIGGFEHVLDRGKGTLTSVAFPVTNPWASFLIGGGEDSSTRVEVVLLAADGNEESVLALFSGRNREQMHRVVVDLQSVRDRSIVVRVVDDSAGGWGHLNFDDFRFHDEPPVGADVVSSWRTTANPLLHHLVPNPTETPAGVRAGDTTAKMSVPEGFSVDVIAAEPQVHQPMAFTFDAKGRLWVVEGHSYPQKRPADEGLDRILIFSDLDHDGSFETRTVFAEELNLVSGLEVGFGGVWVGAAPELLFIPDHNGDDKPDSEPVVLLDGFGFADTHETINSFMWGPDGWLYGNQGVFNSSQIGTPGTHDGDRVALSAGVWRYHPTRHVFEVFAHGGSNQWGLDHDEHGQMFMTYCRSFWGRGDVTHVMQGGHYWNQVNSGYAQFISNQALPGKPWMVNYLLASARYGHGEGGTGKPGANVVYGGHSHVGTMIYLGDNWPNQYRNHLFTHNLHGHQMNHVVNHREAGGYNSRHAGFDMLFCSDPQYIGVDLQYGPDGAVYFSDWYDPRHCHNPDAEQWDRGNGRIYRMKYDKGYQPVSVDFLAATDEQLVQAQSHANDWHARMARRVLSERAVARPVADSAVSALRELSRHGTTDALRLRAIWTLHAIGQLTTDELHKLLRDDSEFVRAWAVQLGAENQTIESAGARGVQSAEFTAALIQAAKTDNSLLVRRYLASAIQRVPSEAAWQIAEALCGHEDSASDRDLPLLLWHGMAPLVLADVDRADRLSDASHIPAIADYIRWYLAARSEDGRALLVERIAGDEAGQQGSSLALLALAVQDARGLPCPDSWTRISEGLYSSQDGNTAALAESIGAAFGDQLVYTRIRSAITNGVLKGKALQRSLRLLSGDSSPENLGIYLQLLNDRTASAQVIPLLGRFSDASVAQQLLTRLPRLEGPDRSAAMEVLCSRVEWSNLLLDRIGDGTLEKSQLTAFYARQMASLNNSDLTNRLETEWGRIGQSSEEIRAEATQLAQAYRTAPLWAYNDEAGAGHFKKLCAQCHQPQGQSEALGPKLTGAGTRGVEYLVENVLAPNAVIGRDYQARIIVTSDGRVITGLVEKESDSTMTIRTLNDSVTVEKSDIEETQVSPNSFMPEGLLKTLNDREKLELLKFLMRQ